MGLFFDMRNKLINDSECLKMPHMIGRTMITD